MLRNTTKITSFGKMNKSQQFATGVPTVSTYILKVIK